MSSFEENMSICNRQALEVFERSTLSEILEILGQVRAKPAYDCYLETDERCADWVASLKARRTCQQVDGDLNYWKEYARSQGLPRR